MIYRIFPLKDTFITNAQRNRVQQTGSNFGASEALDLFKVAGTSGAVGVAGSGSLARILMQFDLRSVAALTASGYAPANGISYKLKLRHSTTHFELPSSYDVTVHPISAEWDEGRGLDVDQFYDKGCANWVKPKQSATWLSAGGDFLNTITSSFHFDDGFEDLEVDVTDIVNAWLTGGLANNGFLLKLTSSIESDLEFNDYYIKRFYSRTSNFKDRRPYLEARWNDFLRDDRANMVWNRAGSLFLYNKVNGQLTDLPVGQNELIVTIADASGSLLTLTGSHAGVVGVYSASFTLPSGSYSGSVFYDMWGSGSFSFMTGTFTLATETATQSNENERYRSVVKNLKNEYDSSDVVRLNVLFTARNYRPANYLTGSNFNRPEILFKTYYAIENDSTRERVVSFGTGSDQNTRLSYDEKGNYFKFHMSNLHAGNVYRILFLVDNDGVQQVIDSDHKFKIV